MNVMEFKLMALTDIWTGDANRQGDRLITTGLLGSIRWWFEVLVRGLGGKACDPTLRVIRCPEPNKSPQDYGHHCVVCELFGCTGWARKFRFEVLDEKGEPKREKIQKDEIFILRFTEIRPISNEEWCLLDLTLRLIADYGAIGGKTVFKPTDEKNRQNEFHHQDFGLFSIEERRGIHCVKKDLETYVKDQKWRTNFRDDHFSWASLANFWCVKGRYLARQGTDRSTFNQMVGRDQRKRCKDCNQVHQPRQKCPQTGKHPVRYSDDNPTNLIDAWLAGRQQESKKVFSFKEPLEARRTFGFVNPHLRDSNQKPLDFNEIRQRLKQVWPDFQDSELLEGQAILQSLLSSPSGGTP